MARPTKYNKKILKKGGEYLSKYEPVNRDLIPLGDIPSPTGLAIHLSISKSTLYDWASDDNKEFSDFLDRVNTLREEYLAIGGLSGQTNSTITKLFLHKYGHSDKQEVEASGSLTINVNR